MLLYNILLLTVGKNLVPLHSRMGLVKGFFLLQNSFLKTKYNETEAVTSRRDCDLYNKGIF
ncbi:hypothetical protein APTSU1_000757800 [Apodemus speciosus]|uniref:Uncharacterized protein n=1 Tax=Apodemus speciosus TaxID=105296 RepID=A0ABQ0EZ68_APOSI